MKPEKRRFVAMRMKSPSAISGTPVGNGRRTVAMPSSKQTAARAVKNTRLIFVDPLKEKAAASSYGTPVTL